MASKKSIIVYTDGACSNNGRSQGARAGIGVHVPGDESNNISRPLEGRQTNQRAEILAAKAGVDFARDQGYTNVTVRTDSEYVRNGIESWLPNWRRDNRTDVVNRGEFEQLSNSMRNMNVKFERVPSAQNPADRLAREGARKVGIISKFIHR